MATEWNVEDMPDQSGKVVIVTGANSGLGYESSLALGRKGAKVIMACRNTSKGEAARDALLEEAPEADLELMTLDLSSLDSVQAFAEAYQANHEQLDLLINNAGVMAPPYQTTADGFEMQIGTNHLGHFALTGRLLDLLLKTSGSRVVNVTSAAQYFGNINFKDLQSEKSYSRYKAYGQSKLANVLFTLELQRRLEAAGQETISVMAHPGYSNTNLQGTAAEGSQSPVEGFFYSKLGSGVAQPSAQGALPQLYAATMPTVKGGDHYGPDGFMELRGYPKRLPPAKSGRNPETAERLWIVSEQLTGVTYEALTTSN